MEFENSVIRTKNRWIIRYEGVEYPSLVKFCEELDLKMPTVQKQLVSGKSIEEVVARGQRKSSNRRAISTARQHPCTVDGVEYPSLAAVATAFGIPMYWLYQFKDKYGLTPQEAAERAREAYETRVTYNSPGGGGNLCECIVEGVTYSSQSDAARAYKVPLSTVTARMARDNTTFAEALALVVKRRKKQMPAQATDKNVMGTLLDMSELPKDIILETVVDALEKYNYQYEVRLRADHSLLIKILENLKITDRPLECFLILNRAESSAFVPVEFYIERLFEPRSSMSDGTLRLLLNDINSSNLGVKLFVDSFSGIVSASGFHLIMKESAPLTLVPALLFFLSSSTDALYKLSNQQ